MSRTTRRRAVRAVAPVAGLLAAGLLVWQGSYAAFSATTTNQQDSWASGQLVLKNNGVSGNPAVYSAVTSTPVINATNIVPGATAFTRCITVESSGTLAGTLKFYRGAITDVNTLAPTFNLSDAINVKVDAVPVLAAQTVDPTCTAGTGTITFPGGSTPILPATALSALPTSYATATTSMPIATAGVVRVAYRLTWTFPSTAADNSYQAASTKADLNWEIQ
jgi:hypothetical protein